MVKLIETTTFTNGDEPKKTEVKFKNIHDLYKGLQRLGLGGQVIYDLKKNKRATLDYKDAKTVIEIDTPKIILTDGDIR